MLLKILLTILLSLVLLFPLQASTIYMPENIAIADKNGELYEVMNKNLGRLNEVKNLEKHLIPKQDWKKIIAEDDAYFSKLLLIKLSSYLPKDELWQYIKIGLLRRENKLNELVADTAYKAWSVFATPKDLLGIRTHSQYRRNLSVLSLWSHMFSVPSKKFNTIEKSVKKLETFTGKIEYYDKRLLRELRTTIALSTDIEQLKELIHHDNFHIALSSMFAIGKLQPKENSFEILSDAIFKNDVFEYDYYDQDGGSNGYLTLGQAAYDLFSDYLTDNQLTEIIQLDPLMHERKRSLNVRTKNVANALLPYKEGHNNIMFILQNWEIQDKIGTYNISKLKKLILRRNVYDYMTDELFTKKMVFAVTELSYLEKGLDEYDYADWASAAFKVHNESAKKLLEYLISGKNHNIKIDDIIEYCYYQHNWPRDWQDIKQKADEIAKTMKLEGKTFD